MTDDRLSSQQIQRQVGAIPAETARTSTTAGINRPARETLDLEMSEIKDDILRMGSSERRDRGPQPVIASNDDGRSVGRPG
jgi:hypothetical protein